MIEESDREGDGYLKEKKTSREIMHIQTGYIHEGK